MGEDIRIKIRSDLDKGLSPTDIYDTLVLEEYDPTEIQEIIRGMYNNSQHNDTKNGINTENGINNNSQETYIAPIIKKKKKRKFSKIKIKNPKKKLIIFGIILFIGILLLILNSIEFNLNITKDPYQIPKDSFHGQVNFLEKIDNSLLNEIIPEANFTLTKDSYQNSSIKGYFFNYTFKNPTTREEGKIDMEVRDYLSSKKSDEIFNKLYNDYKINKIGLINVPTIAATYDKPESFKVVFDLHLEQLDQDGYKVMYIVSEENFLIITNAYFSYPESKEEKNKIAYFSGNRVRKFIHEVSR